MGASRAFLNNTNNISCGSDATLDNIFDGGGAITVWVNATTAPANTFPRVVTKNNAAGNVGWRLETSATPSYLMFYGFSVTSSTWLIGFSFSVWIHLGFVYNSDSDANIPKMYLNGVDTTVTLTTTPVGTRDDDSSLIFMIGNRANLDSAFEGSMCHLQAWDRIITEEEVKEVMHKPGSIPRGMVGYWNLFGNNSPEVDYSVNVNNGTVTGTTVNFDGPPINRAG